MSEDSFEGYDDAPPAMQTPQPTPQQRPRLQISTAATHAEPAPLYAPPNDIAAEMAFLGAMMLGDKDAVLAGCDAVSTADFYRDAHRVIFEAMQALSEADVPVDMVTLKNELNRLGALEGVGGLDYLLQLAGIEFTTANMGHYSQIVRSKALLRQILFGLTDIQKAGYTGAYEGEALLSQLETSVLAIGQAHKTGGSGAVQGIGEIMQDTARDLKNGTGKGYALGVHDFDKILGGLRPGEMTVLAARPSVGKTALMLQWVVQAARSGARCLIASCEMPKKKLALRMALSHARIDWHEIRDVTDFTTLPRTLISRLQDAMRFIAGLPIDMIDNEGTALSAASIVSAARRQKIAHGGQLDILAVDYLQRVEGDSSKPFTNREQEVGDISRALSNFALTGTAVLALCQLNRIERTDEPTMINLRESGRIEQDAYNIVMAWEGDPIGQNLGQSAADSAQALAVAQQNGVIPIYLKIEKQRDGRVGKVNVMANRVYGTFAAFATAPGDEPHPDSAVHTDYL